MSELPIILNTEMVKAVLSGNKVCTRRPLRKQPFVEMWISNGETMIPTDDLDKYNKHPEDQKFTILRKDEKARGASPDTWAMLNAPYQKDDVIYVRETWLDNHEWCMINNGFLDTHESHVLYKANDSDLKIATDRGQKWKPSIHMPKYISRLSLKVTNVRVERVRDITEKEAIKEGMISTAILNEAKNDYMGLYAFEHFGELWEKLYGNWFDSPWVWVIDFEVVNL